MENLVKKRKNTYPSLKTVLGLIKDIESPEGLSLDFTHKSLFEDHAMLAALNTDLSAMFGPKVLLYPTKDESSTEYLTRQLNTIISDNDFRTGELITEADVHTEINNIIRSVPEDIELIFNDILGDGMGYIPPSELNKLTKRNLKFSSGILHPGEVLFQDYSGTLPIEWNLGSDGKIMEMAKEDALLNTYKGYWTIWLDPDTYNIRLIALEDRVMVDTYPEQTSYIKGMAKDGDGIVFEEDVFHLPNFVSRDLVNFNMMMTENFYEIEGKFKVGHRKLTESKTFKIPLIGLAFKQEMYDYVKDGYPKSKLTVDKEKASAKKRKSEIPEGALFEAFDDMPDETEIPDYVRKNLITLYKQYVNVLVEAKELLSNKKTVDILKGSEIKNNPNATQVSIDSSIVYTEINKLIRDISLLFASNFLKPSVDNKRLITEKINTLKDNIYKLTELTA